MHDRGSLWSFLQSTPSSPTERKQQAGHLLGPCFKNVNWSLSVHRTACGASDLEELQDIPEND